jgi:5-deoxy-glucuronate isomerase
MFLNCGGIKMIIRQKEPLKTGFNSIVSLEEKENKTLMDFGILILEKDMVEISSENKERAYLLMCGEVTLEWGDRRETIKRGSYFEEAPWCLHVPAGELVKITGVSPKAELSVTKTYNDNSFAAKLYTDKDCRVENFGKGTLGETSTRLCRTIFDYSNAPYANLVVGELINFPGKWSSYPPHHHPQPEIYFYRFDHEQGFGFSEFGEEVYKVGNNDAYVIDEEVTHAQVAAPGYAMYYIWVIRNLENNPFGERIYTPEHRWLLDRDAKIWPDK